MNNQTSTQRFSFNNERKFGVGRLAIFFAVYYSLLILTGYLDGIVRTLVSVLGTLIFFLIVLLKGRKVSIDNATLRVYILFAAYIFASFLLMWQGYSINNSISVIVKMSIILLIVILTYLSIRNIRSIIFVLNFLMICGFIFFADQLLNLTGARNGGLYSNINSMGFMYSILIVAAFFLYILKPKNIYIVCVFVFGIGLLLTASRASLLMVAVFIVVMFLSRSLDKKFNRIIIIAAIVLVIVCIVKFDYILSKFIRLDSGLAGRNYLWENAFNIIGDNFLFGIGIGNIEEVAGKYLHLIPMEQWRYDTLMNGAIQSSHNMYLDIFMEVGLVGFIVFIGLNVAVFIQFFKLSRSKNLKVRNISVLMIAFLISILARGFFEPMGLIGKGWVSLDSPFWIIYTFAVIAIVCLKKQRNERA